MRIELKKTPRKFQVGQDKQITISDCGNIYLDPDEQVTFMTPTGKEYDFAAKSWGFYATPSVNSRLVNQGFKTALVKNSIGQCYIMVVDPIHMDEFKKYIREEKNEVVEWLDERKLINQTSNNTGVPMSPADIPMKLSDDKPINSSKGFWTCYYKCLFRSKGIKHGPGLRVLGPIILRLDGDPKNITIGKNVTIMPMVDLKIRENGKIILHDGVALDTMARLVAAKEGRIELGDEAQVAMGCIINAGDDVIIGRRTLFSGFCTIIASEHNFRSNQPIMDQGYRRAPVYIGGDVWIAANVLIRPGSRIGNKAVIGAKSIVAGDIPANAVAMGNPCRVRSG